MATIYCSGCNNNLPISNFAKDDKFTKNYLICREKKNQQNARKRAISTAIDEPVLISEFLTSLESYKKRDINNLCLKINTSEYYNSIDGVNFSSKDIASEIANLVYNALNFKFK